MPEIDATQGKSQCDLDSMAFDEETSEVASRSDSEPQVSPVEIELSQYLAEPLMPRPKDKKGNYLIQSHEQSAQTLKYWDVNQHKFPQLAKVARKVLAILPSSADSERLFSAESAIMTPKRNRLAPEQAESLLFISNNMGVE